MIYPTREEISTLLPPNVRNPLVEAGRAHDIAKVDAAHRRAHEMYPEFFREDDDSYSVKEPIAGETTAKPLKKKTKQ